MSNCIFCDILDVKSESSIVDQDEICTALLDINSGHTLVIPNRHTAILADLDEQTAAQLFHVAQQVAAGLRRRKEEKGLRRDKCYF
jgi:histidine triad (HIT) family protein